MHTIAVLNQKGGAGKTTIATNLACVLDRIYGHDIAIIDADPQGTAAEWHTRSGVTPPVFEAKKPTIHEDVQHLEEAFDTLVIDGAPALEDMAVSAIKASDLVLIPVQPSGADIWSAQDIIELVKARQKITDGPRAALVVSRAIVGTSLASSAQDALDSLGADVLSSRTAQRVAYTEALSSGESVLDVRDQKAENEVRGIANEVTSILQDIQQAATQ